MTIPQFRKIVRAHARTHGRHTLPWRAASATPYTILVSEVMLQQTQVDRVVPYYRHFLKQFPTVRALAEASLSDVLSIWQGLGYNRRAKLLHNAARMIVTEHRGRVPRDVVALERLPGVGPYTARAITAFAYNEDTVFVETNLRTAVIHHFFPHAGTKVHDSEILAILEQTLPKGDARAWYAALMDYGAHLKRTGIRVNARSTTYAKQTPFKGSGRELRGLFLKTLNKEPQTEAKLLALVSEDRRNQATTALATLVRDGLIQKTNRRYAVAGGDQ